MTRRYRCGVCGKPGHNRRTCPQRAVRARKVPLPIWSPSFSGWVDLILPKTGVLVRVKEREDMTDPVSFNAFHPESRAGGE